MEALNGLSRDYSKRDQYSDIQYIWQKIRLKDFDVAMDNFSRCVCVCKYVSVTFYSFVARADNIVKNTNLDSNISSRMV